MAACPSGIPKPGSQESLDAVADTCINRDGFNANLVDKYGISDDWVVLANYTARVHAGCWMQESGCAAEQNTVWTGIPLAGAYDVEDPKDTIKPIPEKRVEFQAQMANQAFWSQY